MIMELWYENTKKHFKHIVILAGLIILLWLLYWGAKFFFRLDFSQDYVKVQGVENIIFERNGWGKCYKRCFWGLKQVKNFKVNIPNNLHESDSSKYDLVINTDNLVRQSIYSPDKKYILYSEIQSNYKKTGVTDDEYCYYRIYEITTGKIITIYQAYREWYNLFWID